MRKIALLLIAMTLLSGCIRKDAFRMNGIYDVNIESAGLSSNRISCKIDVTNRSRRDVKVKEVELWVLRNEQRLALASLVDAINIPARTSGAIPVTFSIKFSSKVGIMELLALGSQLESLYVEGEIVVSRGGLNHKIKVTKRPLKDFLDNFL